MEYETLTGDEIRKVIAGEKIDSDDTPGLAPAAADQRDRHPEDQAQGAQGRPGTRGLTDGGGLESRRLRPFSDLRLRPALDLLAQVGALPKGPVVDLGAGRCGGAGVARGVSGGGRCWGVDGSATMLAEAEGQYARIAHADIADWAPKKRPR